MPLTTLPKPQKYHGKSFRLYSETPQNGSKAKKRAWKRVRRLSEISGIPILTARKAYKNLTEPQKKALDTALIPGEIIEMALDMAQPLREHFRRASKGDPTRPVRAGAPNEYIQNTPKPSFVTIDGLKELKEICLNRFGGNWELLAEYATTLGDILKDLK